MSGLWGGEDLTVRYGRRMALEGVSLGVGSGTVTVVVGGDGAGKTTLMRALAGVVPVEKGVVRRPARQRLGYVSGANGIYRDLTVDENIAFSAAAYGLTQDERERRAAALLEQTGLSAARDRLAGDLSGGMRQKLAFALALLHEPELLILDEPTTGVDPVSRNELWRMISRAAAGGAAVVVATAYLDEVSRGAEVVVLEGGRTAAAGPPEVVAAALGMDRARTQGRVVGETGAVSREPPSLAEARGLTRLFGRLLAVDAVDMEVGPGEVVGLLGANGAGKTTLIRMLLGLVAPTDGEALLFGAPPSRRSRQRIGYVPQGLGLWDDLSVGENLAFAGAAFGSAVPSLEADLEAARDTLVRDLPLGLKRRLAFAAALAHSPALLLLDEPTSGVDPAARAHLWSTIHQTAAAGSGVLVTTHYLEEAKECDRLIIMAAGRVVASGPEGEIVGGHTAVEVSPGPGTHWAILFESLAATGMPVTLHGRKLRVPGTEMQTVEAALEAARLSALLAVVPASLEERFVELAAAEGR
jgi:ABC-type multidrug transport system ATPase subunit